MEPWCEGRIRPGGAGEAIAGDKHWTVPGWADSFRDTVGGPKKSILLLWLLILSLSHAPAFIPAASQKGIFERTATQCPQLSRTAAANSPCTVESKPDAPVESMRSVVFTYDAFGRRIGRVISAADASRAYHEVDSRKYVYSGWKLVAELNGNNNSVIRTYIWANNVLLAIIHGNRAYIPTFDGNGNVMTLVDKNTGAVAARYEYSPFGMLLKASGPMAMENPIRFSSEYQDDVTGLIYYGYRYFNPATQTWLSRDPIGMRGGFNLYAMVNNDPVNGRDLYGLGPLSLVCGQGWSGEAADEFEKSIRESAFEQWEEMKEGGDFLAHHPFQSRELAIDAMSDRYADMILNYGENTTLLIAANDMTGGTMFMEGLSGIDLQAQTELFGEERLQRTLMGGGQMGLTAAFGQQMISSARAGYTAPRFFAPPRALAGEPGAAAGKAVATSADCADAAAAETAPKIKPGSIADKPPGWNESWEWHSSTRAKPGSDGWRWRDSAGGEWRRHVPDKHHPEAHWDYNPNSQWNSPWYNVDNNGNLMLFTSP